MAGSPFGQSHQRPVAACAQPRQRGSFVGAVAEKTMRKTYLALGTPKPAKKQGWVKGGMARSRRGTWKLTRDEDNLPLPVSAVKA